MKLKPLDPLTMRTAQCSRVALPRVLQIEARLINEDQPAGICPIHNIEQPYSIFLSGLKHVLSVAVLLRRF